MIRAVHVRQHPRRTPNGPTTVGAHNRAAPSHNRARADDDWFDKHPERIAGRQRLQGLHDEAMWKAFSALQLAEARLQDIPAEDLRSPIRGFHDKAWIQNELRDIRAHIDNVSQVLRDRIWPVSTSAGQKR